MAKLQHFSTTILSSLYVTFQQPLSHANRFLWGRYAKVWKTCQQVSKSVLFLWNKKKKSVVATYTVHACELKALRYSATKSHEWSFVGSYVRGERNQTPCLTVCTWLRVNRVRTTGFIQEEAWLHSTDDVPLLRLLEWKIALSGVLLPKHTKMSWNPPTLLT